MILSDRSIKKKLESGEISIEPFSEEFVQPASYDLHLDRSVLVFNMEKHDIIDVKRPVDDLMLKIDIDMEKIYTSARRVHIG
jgi:dCTP deaminase